LIYSGISCRDAIGRKHRIATKGNKLPLPAWRAARSIILSIAAHADRNRSNRRQLLTVARGAIPVNCLSATTLA
jgi:hypothetical protein